MLFTGNSYALTAADECILNIVRSAAPSITIGELRKTCTETRPVESESTDAHQPIEQRLAPSAVIERFSSEGEVEKRSFAITPHKPNYILMTLSETPNDSVYNEMTGAPGSLDNAEIKFQISIKAPIWHNMFGSNFDTYFAYSAQSWWQVLNEDISSPFRETNYEPEVFIRNLTNYDIFGIKLVGWSLGYNHQSNGRSEPLSRSWNRIMTRIGLQANENLTFLLRTWHRIEEDEEDDDNPNMHHYLGYGDVRAIWTPNRNTFTTMVRPGTQNFSYELTWSYPVSDNFRIYAQYYDGVGESLIDYNHQNRVLGIGFSLNDYLMHK